MAKHRRITIPKNLYGEIVDLIRATANNLRSTTDKAERERYREHGLSNAAIVNAMLDDAVELVRDNQPAMVATLLSRIVPSVLGERITGQPTFIQPLLPGLELADWFAVPSPNHSGAGWKKDRDTTPPELRRIIEHRREIVVGQQVELNKFILVLDTAIELGCGEDQPISTVFPLDDDNKDPPRPDDRPFA
jgi:hypothetical protein